MIYFLISCLNLESFPWEVRNYVLCAKPCILSDTNTTLFMFTKEKKVWNLTQFHSEASDEVTASRYKIPSFLEEFYIILNEPHNSCNMDF